MPATIKDVANVSRTSITTVSRVLNGSDYPVSDKLKKRIKKAAKDLRYTPNLTARSLKTNISTEIAVIVPSIINPYYTSIIKVMEDQFFCNNLGMLVYITGKNGRNPVETLISVKSRKMAGVVIATDSVEDSILKDLCLLKNEGTPIILVDYQLQKNSEMYGVFFDYFKGAGMAAEYLIGKGHRNIVFATTHLDRRSRLLRYEGFCESLQNAGVPLDDSRLLVYSGESTYRAGIELANQIAEMRGEITAVAAINDVVAAGIIMGLGQCGIKVPEEISVIGFDNGEFAMFSHPTLTTVNVPAEKMGQIAASSLISEIRGNAMDCSIFLEPAIVERNSVSSINLQR